ERNAREDYELDRASDAGGVEERARNARGEVEIREIHAEWEEGEWEDDRPRRPDEMHRADFEEDRQQERSVGDEHHHQGRDEDRAAEPEVGLSECVAGGNGHDE